MFIKYSVEIQTLRRCVKTGEYLIRSTYLDAVVSKMISYVMFVLFFVDEIVIRKHGVITDAQLSKMTYHLRH